MKVGSFDRATRARSGRAVLYRCVQMRKGVEIGVRLNIFKIHPENNVNCQNQKIKKFKKNFFSNFRKFRFPKGVEESKLL